MASKHGIHFVGSLGMADAETAFRTLADTVDAGARRYPDGEAGARANWIRYQIGMLEKHPDMELVRTRKDRFAGNQWFLRQVLFERDESGAVTGFRAGGGRVRNLLFERAGRQVAESVLRRF